MKSNISIRLQRTICIFILFSVIGVLVAGCGAQTPESEEKELETVKMIMPVAIMPFMTYYVAEEQGYFADEGYIPELTITGGSGADVNALLAGEVDFALTGLGNILPAYDEGQGIIGIQNMYSVMAFDLVMRKELADELGITAEMPLEAKLQALRGRTIAVSKVGSLSHILARMYARRAGLVEGQDINIIATGSFPAATAAFEAGEVDVIFDIPPTTQRHLLNGTAILLVNNTEGEDPALAGATFEIVATRADLLDKEPEKVRRILRAFTRANQWVATASLEEIADILDTIVPGFERNELLEAAQAAKLGVPADGKFTEAGVTSMLEVLYDADLISQMYSWTEIATNEYIPADLATNR